MAHLEEITEIRSAESQQQRAESQELKGWGQLRKSFITSVQPPRSQMPNPPDTSSSSQNRGNPTADRGGELDGQTADWKEKEEDPEPPQEDVRARFYTHYRKEAEEYDREFVKKHDEDLNTTLIFAGLFSAIASAFVIEVNSDLKPDPNEETAALLRVLIYKIDNTTFNDAPAIPQWTGPPRMTIQVQAILFASLAASLFSAFLAMLGKQWLNRYASADLRGSVIERCRNRQTKLDGIVSWYFENVIELLPVMLQVALLLLGCALSRYLWEINTTIASVVLGVTSLGLFFLLFIVIAGAIFHSCPYQTPGARLLRRLCHAPGVLLSIFSNFFKNSDYYRLVVTKREAIPRNLAGNIAFLHFTIASLPLLLFIDPLTAVAGEMNVLITRLRLMSGRTSEQLRIILDANCLSWTLRTSLDEPTRLLALKFLATTTLFDFNPTLAVDCHEALLRCVKVVNGSVVVVQQSEQLARLSALCLLNALSHLAIMCPWSGVLDDIRQPYTRAFPPGTSFDNLPFSHIFGVIHCIFYPVRTERLLPGKTRSWHAAWRSPQYSRVQWASYRPTSDEHPMVAHSLAKFCRLELGRTSYRKVSRWLLRFALHTLSQEPMPAPSVVTACLVIIWVDLQRCWLIPAVYESLSEERTSSLIERKLETALARGWTLQEGGKAITALFPYAIWRRKNGKGDMLDVFFRIAGATEGETFRQPSAGATSPERQGFMWPRAEPFVTDGVVVRSIRQLKDAKILKSYLLLLWSERWPLRPDGFSEMHVSMCEDFAGIETGYHRTDLIRTLDQFLEQLDHEQGSPGQEMKDQYCVLKEALAEAEKKVLDVLTESHSTFVCALPLMCL